MDYPTLMYRCPGAHFGPAGQTYDYAPAQSEEDMQYKLKAGWHVTMQDAVTAVTAQAHEDEQDDAPITRAELEEMAESLGLKFDGRTTDASLLKKIEAATGGEG